MADQSVSRLLPTGTCVDRIGERSDGAMYKRIEPSCLQDMVYWKVGEMVRAVGHKWTRRLYSAALRSRNTWLQEIQRVEAECVLLRQKLSLIPLQIISELVKRYTFEDFVQIIAFYDKNNGRPSITRIWDREFHQKICENILKSVLFPCIPIYNLSNLKSEFVEELLIKLLYCTPNTEILILPQIQHLNYMQLLVQNIHILNHLQEFNFQVGCTTEIIVELAKYCPYLKNIDVEHSERVDNNCVEHLLKLIHLQNLNVAGTSVFNNGYRALLSRLPEVQNIVWFRPIDPILSNVTGYLHSVRLFVGNISNTGLLVQKCPNINELTLFSITGDTSGLGELRNVSALRIIRGSCIVMKFNDVVRRFGGNLTALKMHQVRDINIYDIICFCTVLSSLDISYCRTIIGEVLDHKLSHFQNLEKLKLKRISGTFDFRSVLQMYSSLKELHVADMEAVTETLIMQIATIGGFRYLTKFVAEKCGYMSIDTAWVLVQNCPNLIEIGNIYTWSAVTPNEVETFIKFVRNNNLALAFVG